MFVKIIVSILVVLLASCSIGSENKNHDNSNDIRNATGMYITGMTERQKVMGAQKRRKQFRNIRKGDYMTLKNNPEQAIAYYQQALEQLPNDIVIQRKLAHTYFLTKDWKNSYRYYSQVPINELNDEEKDELFFSLFYDESRPDRLIELSRYTLEVPLQEYYQAVDICYSGTENCINKIMSYSGSSLHLQEAKKSIEQASKVSPDPEYRNFVIATFFYKQSMYRLVDLIAANIIKKKPTYTEVKKLQGFALYELGKYELAKKILLSYLESYPNDIETIIRLGRIFYRLGDYATSNLYLNNAITQGYAKKTEIERQLAYNYAAMGKYDNMLKVLSYLLQEDDVNEDDYAVAISLAFRNGQSIKAYAWAYAGIEKFSNSKILIPLYLQAMRTQGKMQDVLTYIAQLPSETRKNPLIQLERAISLYELGNLDDANDIFVSIYDLDQSADWGIEAHNYIRIIAYKKSQEDQDKP